MQASRQKARTKVAVSVAAAAVLAAATVAAALAPSALAAPAGPVHSTVALVPHRAVYDLKLLRSRGKRALEQVRGRILYDFSGSPCDGYALQFRQVSELDSGEGKVALSDLRATTWEDGAAKSFRFNSQNFVDRAAVDAVDGRANRDDNKVEVALAKPKQKSFDMAKDMVFPTEHMRLIIEAARAEKNLVEVSVFDGSDGGDKIYNTLTVIGTEIAPDQRVPTDAAAGKPELAGLKRWPVTISYFDSAGKKSEGEQTPAYSISFELYENGISRALKLDYGDFVVGGEMSQLEVKDVPSCK
jgi:hypothetical protein